MTTSSCSTPAPGDSDDRLVTAGGRVLNLVGLGRDVAAARDTAYAAVETVDFAGKQYRKDIAHHGAHG